MHRQTLGTEYGERQSFSDARIFINRWDKVSPGKFYFDRYPPYPKFVVYYGLKISGAIHFRLASQNKVIDGVIKCFMKFIGNILWLVLGGLLVSLGYFIAGLLYCVTIVGIPFGYQLWKFGVFSLCRSELTWWTETTPEDA